MEKTNYEENKQNIFYAHTEIYNINISSLSRSRKFLDNFLEKNKDKEIQEIRDLLKASEIYIGQAIKKLDNILDNISEET